VSPPRVRVCDVDFFAPCTDVNCTRRNLCSRIALAKRRMSAHDRKNPRARRWAWGADYDATRRCSRQKTLAWCRACYFR
jgi:hypothetical protein